MSRSMPIEVRSGEVYYDPSTEKLFRVHETHEDYCVCGGFERFYEVAATITMRQNLSFDYIGKCYPIGRCLDKSRFLELNQNIHYWEAKPKDRIEPDDFAQQWERKMSEEGE